LVFRITAAPNGCVADYHRLAAGFLKVHMADRCANLIENKKLQYSLKNKILTIIIFGAEYFPKMFRIPRHSTVFLTKEKDRNKNNYNLF